MSHFKDETEVIRAFLEDGRVDPRIYNNEVIKFAARKGYTDIVKLLLEDGRIDP